MAYLKTEGTFEAVVMTPRPDQGWFGQQGERETPFVCLTLKVDDGSACQDQTIQWKGWLSPDAQGHTCATLGKVFPDFDGDLIALAHDQDAYAGKPHPIVGHRVQIEVECEVYNEKPTYKVKWLNAIGGGGFKVIPVSRRDALLKSLCDASKAAVQQARQGKTATPPAPRAASAMTFSDGSPVPNDEEIAF